MVKKKGKGRKVSSCTSNTEEVASVDEERVSNDGDGATVDDDASAGNAASDSVWDLVRVLAPPLPPSDDDDNATTTTTPTCRMDGCAKAAVVVWAENLQPHDEWPLCEECQAKEFGGWPDGIQVEPPPLSNENNNNTQVQDHQEVEKQQEQQEEQEQEGQQEEQSEEDEAKKVENNDKENGNDKEVWELTKILSIQEITENPTPCYTDKCKLASACVWVSNLNPTDDWFMCLDCQTADFGGFPPANELPVANMTPEHLEIMAKQCSRKNPKMPNFSGSSSSKTPVSNKASSSSSLTNNNATITPLPYGNENDDEQEDIDDEAREVWDLKKILSVQDLTECPVKCSTETCSLPAACVWVSNQAPTTKWYSCLDCQAKDFGGWPPREELPVPHLTQEHMDLLAQKCSRQKKLEMSSFSLTCQSLANPSALLSSHTTVTPMPGKQEEEDEEDNGGGGANTTAGVQQLQQTMTKKASQQQPSKQALAMHRKWQEAAEAMGGKDARIVVSAPKAKKLVFDLLETAFRPMNITEIHKELKAAVPSPVLKACLDEMALESTDRKTTFTDSDDEDEEDSSKTTKKKAKASSSLSEDANSSSSSSSSSSNNNNANTDSYKASLCFKAGKTSNATLYYVNYVKLKNNGNGLEPHERNELAASVAKAQAEEAALRKSIQQLAAETTQLLSEPTNEEAVARLEQEEAELQELSEKVEVARMHKVNEKHKVKVKRSIENMTAQWRKRRRICLDFLISMEENTEGSINMKKCLAGDGLIDIDSDEAVAKGAVAFARKKRFAPAKMMTKSMRAPAGAKKAKLNSSSVDTSDSSSIILASENFVAVTLDSQGRAARVLVDDDDSKE